MAKFDELYPNQIAGDLNHSIDFEGSELIKTDEEQPCWNCNELTKWADINFQAYLCSEECERIKWQEFIEAYNKHTCGDEKDQGGSYVADS